MQRRIVVLAAAGIVLVLVVLVGARVLTRGAASAGTPDSRAPDSLVAEVTTLPPAVLDQVGRGDVSQMPTPVRAGLERDARGQPLVTYVGAEYCPFCAGERWALIAALGRFGTFSGLQLSHSATNDVYPNTATFSFVDSTYTSQYVGLDAVELQTTTRQTLQTPTPAENALIRKYDAPPYVPASSAGSIPFIDLAGQYVVAGATFDVGTLRDMTQEQIAASLSQPSSPQAQAILGSANVLTAAICSATADNPNSVCGSSTIQSLESSLARIPTRS